MAILSQHPNAILRFIRELFDTAFGSRHRNRITQTSKVYELKCGGKISDIHDGTNTSIVANNIIQFPVG